MIGPSRGTWLSRVYDALLCNETSSLDCLERLIQRNPNAVAMAVKTWVFS